MYKAPPSRASFPTPTASTFLFPPLPPSLILIHIYPPLLLPFSPKWLAQLSLTGLPHPCSPPSATSARLGKSDRTPPFLMISRAHYPWPAFVVPRDQDSRIPRPNASNDV